MSTGFSLAEVASQIEKIVKTASYVVYGTASGGLLLYGSTESGTLDLYVTDPGRGYRSRVAERIHMLAASDPSSDYVVFTRDVSRGFELCRIYAVNVRTGEVLDVSGSTQPQRIAGLAFNGKYIAWSGATKDSAGVYLAKLGSEPELVARTQGREFVSDVGDEVVVGYGHLRGDPFSTELFILSTKSREMKTYTPREGSTNLAPRVRGTRVLFASDFEDLDRERLYVLDVESGMLSRASSGGRDLLDFDPVEYVEYDWLEDSTFWAVGKRKGRAHLFIDGRLVGPNTGFVSSAAVYCRRAYLAHSSLRTPPRILSVDLETGELSVVAGGDLPEEVSGRLGNAYYVEVESFDGLKIPTYVLESAVAPKPGPVVVYPHGGPWAEVADTWTPIVATLATLGYHVVAPNFRGSTGYGQRFRKMDIGDPGGADMEDVAEARKWAMESGLAREGSVAIVGYSYGGYTALMQLTRKPDLWKCGVAGAPVADWEEMYELADAYFKRFEEILFAGKKELFRERSPITYVENVKAPLCVVQPQNDSRTPLKPVLRFVQRLMELGKSFELHVIPDIGHTVGLDRKALAAFLLYTALFLEKHMKAPT